MKLQLNRKHYSTGPVRHVLFDSEDATRIKKHKWFYNAGYAYAWIGGRRTSLQRFIMGVPPNDKHNTVDHANHNPMDNRKVNLRVCTPAQNAAGGHRSNSARRFRGVSVVRGKYAIKITAMITACGENVYLGDFTSDVEAALAWDKAARLHHGEFAILNFPNGKVPDGIKPILAKAYRKPKEFRREFRVAEQSIGIALTRDVVREIRQRATNRGETLSAYLRTLIGNALASEQPQLLNKAA